jgi:hypothetical protein
MPAAFDVTSINSGNAAFAGSIGLAKPIPLKACVGE